MKLSTLNLANYRGYDQLSLEFDPELTVIAGVNGVGKSSLLAAIVHCASQILPQVTSSKEDKIGLYSTDRKAGKETLTLSAVFETPEANLYVDTTRKEPVSAEEAEKLAEEIKQLRANIRETSKGSEEERRLQEKIGNIEIQLSPEDIQILTRVFPNAPKDVDDVITRMKNADKQPLVVCYSTSRFISRLPPRLAKAKKIDISTAYSKSLNQLEVSLYEFANWYRVQQEDKERAESLFTQLNQAVGVFLESVGNLELHEDTSPPRFSIDKKGIRFFLEQLSDGERGLLALVFDLTRRLCIANPESDNPLTEGKAIVLIDEIELHLHPKWQRMVVRKLREVFPACQFIITTHSPQVIGQVKPDKLRLLVQDDSGRVVLNPVSQTYGMDSSWVLENIMGVPARDYETEQRLSAIYDAIDAEDFAKARTLANMLRNEIGDFPDLQEAIALLDRFELLGQG